MSSFLSSGKRAVLPSSLVGSEFGLESFEYKMAFLDFAGLFKPAALCSAE